MSVATLSQAQKVLELISQKKIPSEQLQALLESGLLPLLLEANVERVDLDDFRRVVGLRDPVPDVTEVNVFISEVVHFDHRIAAGGYDRKHEDITEERFPVTLPASLRTLVLIDFKRVMSSQKVEAWAAQHGYEMAVFDDLLAVGCHPSYMELQRQFPIVQLGSSAQVDGRRRVPCLGPTDTGRLLGLGWYDTDWIEDYRFLLVRKQSLTV